MNVGDFVLDKSEPTEIIIARVVSFHDGFVALREIGDLIYFNYCAGFDDFFGFYDKDRFTLITEQEAMWHILKNTTN